ncbi:protein FAM177A1 [Danio aesculapii]|uniref:protein FAM177A1 n=1 Tax=Danio aesculapii TaxID=1142201 RepID=UPI0024C06DDA|nr:protein FAM177A1 [Danio aesculapii]
MQTNEPLEDIRDTSVKRIYFSSGETLTDEDSEEEEDLHQAASCVSEPGNWTWKDHSRIWGSRFLKKSLQCCDFLGERMAGLLGLNAAKYQYAIDHHRDHKGDAGAEPCSTNTSMNEEKINLSQMANKQYGATNTADATQKHTPQCKGEQNEGFNSIE